MRVLWFLGLSLWASFSYSLPNNWSDYFINRQLAAREHTLSNLSADNTNIHTQLIRFHHNEGPLDVAAFTRVIEKLNQRRDTSDFDACALVRMLYQYGDSDLWDQSSYGPGLKQAVVDTLLNFKYWIDEPGLDPMVYWSENHQILFHSAAYLMGQMFPDSVFTNSGLTGTELKAKHEPMLKRWIQLRAQAGFSEWHSNNYYEEDIGPLLNIIDFADDPLLVNNAKGVAQLLLLDIALYSHQGVFAGSHGRTFERKVANPEGESTRATAHLVFEQGSFNRTGGVSFSPLSVTENFLPDPAVILIGRKDWHQEQGIPSVWNDHSRMGFDPSNAHEFNISLDPNNFDDVVVWWGNGGYILPEVLPGTFEIGKGYNLFTGNDFLKPFAGLVMFWDLGWLDPILEMPIFKSIAEAGSLQTTHTTAHHKPSSVLSVALDKSKGNPSIQNHAWSAVMNGNIQVFSNHPLLDLGKGDYLDYFTGAASMPRIAQYEDVAIILNNPNILLTAFVSDVSRTTHAFFPFEKFDETEVVGNWYFGKKDDGYIALYSYNQSDVKQDGRFPNQEIVANGIRNLWICETGWAQEDGSFQEFILRVSQQKVTFQKYFDLSVTYQSDQGAMKFSWNDEFTVEGQSIPLNSNPRYSNPFLRTDWKDTQFLIEAGELSSNIEFDFSGSW